MTRHLRFHFIGTDFFDYPDEIGQSSREGGAGTIFIGDALDALTGLPHVRTLRLSFDYVLRMVSRSCSTSSSCALTQGCIENFAC